MPLQIYGFLKITNGGLIMFQIEFADSRKNKTYYLIDTENQGGAEVLPRILSKDNSDAYELILFYTDHSQNLAIPVVKTLLLHPNKVHFVECFYGRKNALDFQLVSYLGYLISQCDGVGQFVIISNDLGFDSVVNYWKRKNVYMQRIGSCESFDYLLNDINKHLKKIEQVHVNPSGKLEACKSKPVPDYTVPKEELVLNDSSICSDCIPVTHKTFEEGNHLPDTAKCETKSLRPVGADQVSMAPKTYKKALQIFPSMLGAVLKQKKIKVLNIPRVAEYMFCHIDYTEDEMVLLTSKIIAANIMEKLPKSEINRLIIETRKKCQK